MNKNPNNSEKSNGPDKPAKLSRRKFLGVGALGALSLGHGLPAARANGQPEIRPIADARPEAPHVPGVNARTPGHPRRRAPRRVFPVENINRHLQRYLYAPVLEFPAVDGARRYVMRMVDSRGARHEIVSEESAVSLGPVWENLAPGFVRTNTVAQLDDGPPPAFSQSMGRFFTFFRATPFDPEREAPARNPWDETLDRIYVFLAGLEHEDNHDPDLPVLIWHAALSADSGRLYSRAYPGLHYHHYIRFFMEYARMRPERAEEARRLAGVVAAHSRQMVTPGDSPWPGLPYSTISRGEAGALWEKEGVIQPLKGALMANALFDYARQAGDGEAMAFAVHVGTVLAERQHPGGGLPFRINIHTGESEGGESTNLVDAVRLWERLESIHPGRFAEARDKGIEWLMERPVKDQQWISTFEDVPTAMTGEGSRNYNHADATRMAFYLLEQRTRQPHYLELAKEIDRWVEEGFVFYAPEHPIDFLRFPAPAVTEQASHYYPIDSHMARYARLQARLFRATGKRLYLEKAMAMANALTHYVNDREEPITYAPDPDLGYGYTDAIWFGCAAHTGLGLMEVIDAAKL